MSTRVKRWNGLRAPSNGGQPGNGTEFPMWTRIGWLVLAVWMVVGGIFAVTLLAQRVDVKVGDLAPRSVVAPYGVIDWGATARARSQAAAQVPNVYSVDPSVLNGARKTAIHDFQLISTLAADPAAPISLRAAVAGQVTDVSVPQSIWNQVLSLPPARIAQLQEDAMVILASVMGNGNGVRNTQTGIDEARGFVAQLAAQEEPDPGVRLFLTNFGQHLVAANTFLNVADTLAKKQAAAAQVPTVKILRGEQVLVQGQRVTAADIQVLKELGLLDKGFDPGPILGALLYSAILVGVLAAYVWYLRRTLLSRPATLVIAGILLVVGLVGAELLNSVPFLSYLVVPTVVMMVAALVDAGLGLVVAAILALSIAVLTGVDVNVAVVSFFGGIAGVFGVTRLSQRYDIIRAGLIVGLVNLMALVGLDVMQGASLVQYQVWQGLAWGVIDGVLAAIVAMGSLPFLEGPFGLITAMKLIELSNPNQPLLRKLLVEAPGTYYHSIMVGNLAEAATEAVGGNSLLARVGAFYHDIGKSKRPYFFVDNQFGGENPHDKLSPSLSAIIISSHVRDGVEMAKAHRLPQAIVEFIREHHGTTMIGYFYNKALDQDTGEGVVEGDFRYDGPRPQSKETAIVMLADASEATCRSLKHPTPQSLEQVVRRLIKERLQDGQLDESNLTLKELDIIAQTFTRVLTGVFHQRIEYPERVLKEMERSRNRGGLGGKSTSVVRRMGGNSSAGGPPNAG